MSFNLEVTLDSILILIKFTFEEGRKHKTVNIHVGGVSINDKDKITTRPKKKKKSKVEKIINVLKEKEDEV